MKWVAHKNKNILKPLTFDGWTEANEYLEFTKKPTNKDLITGKQLLEYKMRYILLNLGRKLGKKVEGTVLSGIMYHYIYLQDSKHYALVATYGYGK